MLSLSFWVLDWQRHALWISLQKSEGGYENKSKEDVFEILLLMLSRSKWIAFHLVVSLLARAYQVRKATMLQTKYLRCPVIWRSAVALDSTRTSL